MGAKTGTINGKVTQGQRPGMEEKEKQEKAGQYSNLQVDVKANLKGQWLRSTTQTREGPIWILARCASESCPPLHYI